MQRSDARRDALEEAARLVEAMAGREQSRHMSLSLGEVRLREAAAAIRRMAEERDDG